MKVKKFIQKSMASFLIALLPFQAIAEYSPSQKSSLMQMNNALNDMSIALQAEIDYANKVRNDANQIPQSFKNIVIYNPHGALNVGLETIDLSSYIAVCSGASMTLSRNERRASELNQLMNKTLNNIDNAANSGLTLPVPSTTLKSQVTNSIQKQYDDAIQRRNAVLNGVNWNVVGDGFMEEITRISKDINVINKDINFTGNSFFSEVSQELSKGAFPITLANGKVVIKNHQEMVEKISKFVKVAEELKKPGDKFQEILNSNNPDKAMLKYLIQDFVNKVTETLRGVEENKALFEAYDNNSEISKNVSELKEAINDLNYAKQQITDIETWKPNYAQMECANTITPSLAALQKRLLEKKYWRVMQASMTVIAKTGNVFTKAMATSNPVEVSGGGIAKFKNLVSIPNKFVNSIVTFRNHLFETDLKAKSAMVYKRYMDASLISDNTFKATMGQVRANLKNYCQSSVKPLLDSPHSNLRVEPETTNGAVCYKIAASSQINVSLVQPNSTIWDGISPFPVTTMVSVAPNKGAAIQVLKGETVIIPPIQLKQMTNNYVGNNTFSVDLATNNEIKKLANGAYTLKALVNDSNNRAIFSDKIPLTIARSGGATISPIVQILSSTTSLNENGLLTLRAITENLSDVSPVLNIQDSSGKVLLQTPFNLKLASVQGKQHWQYQAPVGVKAGSYVMFAKIAMQDGKMIESNKVPLNVSAVVAPAPVPVNPAAQPAMQRVQPQGQVLLNQLSTIDFVGQNLTSEVKVTLANCELPNPSQTKLLSSSIIRLVCTPRVIGQQQASWKMNDKDILRPIGTINVSAPVVAPPKPVTPPQQPLPQPTINISANPNTVQVGQQMSFVANINVPATKVELIFTDANNLTELMTQNSATQWSKRRTMQAAATNRPFMVRATLANGNVITQTGSFNVMAVTPTPVPQPQPTINVSVNPNTVQVGQQMSFVANLNVPATKVELIFTDANNLTELMTQNSATQWIKTRTMQVAATNRPFKIRATLPDGKEILNTGSFSVLAPVSSSGAPGETRVELINTPSPTPAPVQPPVIAPAIPQPPVPSGEVPNAVGCTGNIKQCGVDGRTYPNACTMKKAGVTRRSAGAC